MTSTMIYSDNHFRFSTMLDDKIVIYNDGRDNHYHPQPDVRLTKVAEWYVNPRTNVCERPWEVKWVAHNRGCKHD